MADEPVLKSDISIFTVVLHVIAMLLWPFFPLYMWAHFDREASAFWLGAAVAILASMHYAWLVISTDKITIYEDRFETRSILGFRHKVHYFKDISAWRQMPGRYYYTYYKLVLYINKKRYVLESDNYNNYGQLINKLTAGKPRDEQGEQKYHRTTGTVLAACLIAFGALAIAGCIFLNVYADNSIKQSDIVFVTGRLSSNPVIHHKKNNGNIQLRLAEYPAYTFIITGNGYNLTNDDIVDYVFSPDSITLGITKADKKTLDTSLQTDNAVSKDKQLKIEVYDIEISHQKYLSLGKYLAASDQRNEGIVVSIFLAVVGILMLIFGIIIIRKIYILRLPGAYY